MKRKFKIGDKVRHKHYNQLAIIIATDNSEWTRLQLYEVRYISKKWDDVEALESEHELELAIENALQRLKKRYET